MFYVTYESFAIKPTDGAVFAPISGTIRQILPTRHAVGIESEDGVIVLIHVGIGTVKLKGEGFISYVEQGDRASVKVILRAIMKAPMSIAAAGKPNMLSLKIDC